MSVSQRLKKKKDTICKFPHKDIPGNSKSGRQETRVLFLSTQSSKFPYECLASDQDERYDDDALFASFLDLNV